MVPLPKDEAKTELNDNSSKLPSNINSNNDGQSIDTFIQRIKIPIKIPIKAIPDDDRPSKGVIILNKIINNNDNNNVVR